MGKTRELYVDANKSEENCLNRIILDPYFQTAFLLIVKTFWNHYDKQLHSFKRQSQHGL